MQLKSIDDRRIRFRAKYNGIFFSSYFNGVLVLLILTGFLFYSAQNIHWDLRLAILLPLGFLYSDAAMYLAHRYQQHKKIKSQEIIFEMHSFWHHGMFTNEKMHVDSTQDMNMVILPFFVHGLVLGGIYFPIALLGSQLQLDIGRILLFAVAIHSLWYEFIHAIAHLENPPIFKNLAKHHKEHHNPKNMGSVNFGIATTLFDRVFRTRFISS